MTVTINGTSGVTFPDSSTQAVGFYGFKNRIINGAMMIDQRNGGASVTPTDTGAIVYSLDRWFTFGSVASKFSIQQNAGSITPPVGFTNYLGITSLSAYSIISTSQFVVGQTVEGFNIADLGWGTASAKTITISFQVYSSLTGTFGGSLRNASANRSYPFTYSIPVANTWTTISLTIAGDTSGTWNTTNGVGLYLSLSLGAGSTVSGTAGAWAGANYISATGAVSVVGTNGATFYITGVQLEKVSTATSFDYRPYGTELMLCQRYYEKGYPQGTAPANGALSDSRQGVATVYGTTVAEVNQIRFEVVKRTAPTVTLYNSSATSASAGQWSLYNPAVGWVGYVASAGTTDTALGVTLTVSALTSTGAYISSGNWAVSAEL